MAATAAVNGTTNGSSRSFGGLTPTSRFSDVPAAIDIPVSGPDGDEAVEVNLEDHLDDPTELCQLLENERAAKNLWITIALAYAKQEQIDHSLDILDKGLSSLAKSGPKERLSLLGCVAWLDLLKGRDAPRVVNDGSDTKTKDHYLREATATINEALRINPAFPPLYLTRGVLNLLKASLTASTKTGSVAEAERIDFLRQALKCFDDALKASDGRNMMAAMGRARALYLLKQYQAALLAYQNVLSKMPSMTEPDPRIGIGCCLWQLGFHEQARLAWQRSLQLNENSKTAHALLGVYFLRESGKHPADDPQFTALYKKAMAEHIRKAYTIDKSFPLSCAIFASYFLLTGRHEMMEPLARKAIEQTDVNAIASDGWYLIARREHTTGDLQKAHDAYNKSDQARGGMDKGYWPAKFGMIQIMVQSQDLDGAKFRLEKIAQSHKSIEATTLLGCVYAEEVFSGQRSQTKEDKTGEARKAITLLENVRKSWSDEKTKSKPDEAVLLYLARLYEHESPLESMKCLAEVQNMQIGKIPNDELPPSTGDSALDMAQVKEHLPPQLLNNIACFFYGGESYEMARETFEIALNACVKLNDKQEAEKRAVEDGTADADDIDNSDTDALVTTISYNLARTYEALGQKDEAQKVYEGLLSRHSDYTEAQARLAYIALQDSPQEHGPRRIAAVYQSDYGNTEVRALMGWYYHSSKRKTMNIAEDNENRHYKHTLQGYDKHDLYSLVGMGNIHLAVARDMPRNNDLEKEKRGRMYQKAYEFFDKALQLDPKNSYAAQGIAIALCDDKKNYSEALQILTKVKDTIRDASVYVNLGHVYAELRQFQRSIDNYDAALRKEGDRGSSNAQLLACLSRVWLLKGKNEKSIYALNTSLDYMKRALATQPDSPHLQFNVAFIQFQIVQLVNSLSESARTLEDVNGAREGLEQAIATFEEVAKAKNPPYPRSALEQRAAMSKGTMRKQLERTHERQTEYERTNETKLRDAKERRAEELRKREEKTRVQREEEEAKAKRMEEERMALTRETEKLVEQLRAEQMAREAMEYTTDEETGDRIKKKEKKSKSSGRGGGRGRKRDREVDDFIEDDNEEEGKSERSVSRTPISGDEDEEMSDKKRRERSKSKEPKKKRRKLERRGGGAVVKASTDTATTTTARKEKPGKFKSAAVVVDSDSEEEPEAVETPPETADAPTPVAVGIDMEDDDDNDGDVTMKSSGGRGEDGEDEDEDIAPKSRQQPAPRKRKQLRTIADDDDEEDEDEDGIGGSVGGGASVSRSSQRIMDDDDEDDN